MLTQGTVSAVSSMFFYVLEWLYCVSLVLGQKSICLVMRMSQTIPAGRMEFYFQMRRLLSSHMQRWSTILLNRRKCQLRTSHLSIMSCKIAVAPSSRQWYWTYQMLIQKRCYIIALLHYSTRPDWKALHRCAMTALVDFLFVFITVSFFI